MLDQWLRGTAHYGLVSFPDPIARGWALILGMRLAGHVYVEVRRLCNALWLFRLSLQQLFLCCGTKISPYELLFFIGQALNGGRRPHGSVLTHRASLY